MNVDSGGPIAESYADCIDLKCPGCPALPGEWCRNQFSGLPRRTPCWARIRLSDNPTDVEES